MSTVLAVTGSPLGIYRTVGWTRQDDPNTPTSGVGCAFSPNGTYFAQADSASPYVEIWTTSNYSRVSNPVNLPTGGAYDVAFSPDSAYLAVAHTSSPYITIYNTGSWTKVTNPATLPAHSTFANATGVAWSPDGTQLFVGVATDGANSGDAADHSVNVYTWPGLVRHASFTYMPGYCNGGAWSASGTWLAVPEFDSPYITRYLTSDWSKLSAVATPPTGVANGVAFSPNGTWMAVAHNSSPRVSIYLTADWSKVANPGTLPTGDGFGVAFSSDSAYLAVAHDVTPFITIYNTSDWSKVTNPASLPTVSTRCAFGSPTLPPVGFQLTLPVKLC